MGIAANAGTRMNEAKPWGVLSGVRPTKIVHRLLDRKENPAAVYEELIEQYGLWPEKARLLTQIALHNRRWVSDPTAGSGESRQVSVYLGIPYCSSRCSYCSFPSALLPADEEQIVCLLRAIGQDIQAVVKLLSNFGLQIRNLYIGGGTPTCLPERQFARLLELLNRAFSLASIPEVTLEAGRPDSISVRKLEMMRQAGVTRISVNPQSLQQRTLDRIGRKHSAGMVFEALTQVRAAGFEFVNMDLIAGLPGETATDMADTLCQVLARRPENITVHTLALKRGAPLYDQTQVADLPEPTVVHQMVGSAAKMLQESGYYPYYLYRQKNSPGNLENVGYSLPQWECVYNVDIIEERRTLIGCGPAAASKAVRFGSWKLDSCHFPKNIPAYIRTLDELIHKRNRLIESVFLTQ